MAVSQVNPVYQGGYTSGMCNENDYFGIHASDPIFGNTNVYGYNYGQNFGFGNTNYACNPGYNTGGYGYNTYPGMYQIPQNLWNDPIGQLEYQDNLNQQSGAIYNRNSGQQLEVSNQCRVLASLIGEGKENEVLKEFQEIETALKGQQQYSKCTDQEIKAIAQSIFQQSTGVPLVDAINQNCKSNFETGLGTGFFLGNADSVSKEDLIAEINGTEPPHGGSKIVGGIIGAIGSILCLGIPALFGEHG